MSARGVESEILAKQRELDKLRERSGQEHNRQRLLDAWDRMRRITGSYRLAPDSKFSSPPLDVPEDDCPGAPIQEQIHTSLEVVLAQMMELMYLHTRYGHLLEEDVQDLMGETVYRYIDLLRRYIGQKQCIEPSNPIAVRGELDEEPEGFLDSSVAGPLTLDHLEQALEMLQNSNGPFPDPIYVTPELYAQLQGQGYTEGLEIVYERNYRQVVELPVTDGTSLNVGDAVIWGDGGILPAPADTGETVLGYVVGSSRGPTATVTLTQRTHLIQPPPGGNDQEP